MPTLGRTRVGLSAQAFKLTLYVCPFWITISRWRTWASQGFAPLFWMSMHSAPLSTMASPVAGLVNDVIQGKLLPSLKSLFFSKFPPGGAADAAAVSGMAGGAPVPAWQPSTDTSSATQEQ